MAFVLNCYLEIDKPAHVRRERDGEPLSLWIDAKHELMECNLLGRSIFEVILTSDPEDPTDTGDGFRFFGVGLVFDGKPESELLKYDHFMLPWSEARLYPCGYKMSDVDGYRFELEPVGGGE